VNLLAKMIVEFKTSISCDLLDKRSSMDGSLPGRSATLPRQLFVTQH
jgi:hypothetical protein